MLLTITLKIIATIMMPPNSCAFQDFTTIIENAYIAFHLCIACISLELCKFYNQGYYLDNATVLNAKKIVWLSKQ